MSPSVPGAAPAVPPTAGGGLLPVAASCVGALVLLPLKMSCTLPARRAYRADSASVASLAGTALTNFTRMVVLLLNSSGPMTSRTT